MTQYLNTYSVPESFLHVNFRNCVRDGVIISIVDTLEAWRVPMTYQLCNGGRTQVCWSRELSMT